MCICVCMRKGEGLLGGSYSACPFCLDAMSVFVKMHSVLSQLESNSSRISSQRVPHGEVGGWVGGWMDKAIIRIVLVSV